jgi:probable phosphoglycerate mutase
MTSKTIYLLRHGDYINEKNIVPGVLPYKLSPKGIDQIREILEKINEIKISIDIIYTSPVIRCLQSAEILKKGLEIDLKTRDELIEIRTPFQGMDWDKYNNVSEEKGIYAQEYHINFDGESIEDISSRMKQLIDEILNSELNHVLLVSHGDPTGILLANLKSQKLNPSERIKYQTDYIQKGEIRKLVFENNKFIKEERV